MAVPQLPNLADIARQREDEDFQNYLRRKRNPQLFDEEPAIPYGLQSQRAQRVVRMYQEHGGNPRELYWLLNTIHISETEEVKQLSQSVWRKVDRAKGVSRTGGRPAGRNLQTMLLGVLAEEFRLRFGRPNYDKQLILVQAVDPAITGKGKERPLHRLKQRIRLIPRSTIQTLHKEFFPK